MLDFPHWTPQTHSFWGKYKGWKSYTQWQAKNEACPSFSLQTQAVRVAANHMKLSSAPSFLPLEGVPTESGWSQLPRVPSHTMLQRPRVCGCQEGGMSLSPLSSHPIKWLSDLLGFLTGLLFLKCPKQQKSVHLISLGQKSSKELHG